MSTASHSKRRVQWKGTPKQLAGELDSAFSQPGDLGYGSNEEALAFDTDLFQQPCLAKCMKVLVKLDERLNFRSADLQVAMHRLYADRAKTKASGPTQRRPWQTSSV